MKSAFLKFQYSRISISNAEKNSNLKILSEGSIERSKREISFRIRGSGVRQFY